MAACGTWWQHDGSEEEVNCLPKWMRGGIVKDFVLLYRPGTGQRNYVGSECVV
jgi:hypothetical protein